MRKAFILSAIAIALPCVAGTTTQFFLIPMKEKPSASATAVIIDPPKKVTFKSLNCATTANLGGIVSEFASHDESKDYTGTAYTSEMKLGDGQVSGFVMNKPLPVGARLSNFKVAENGETCAELIDGKPVAFRKYVVEIETTSK